MGGLKYSLHQHVKVNATSGTTITRRRVLHATIARAIRGEDGFQIHTMNRRRGEGRYPASVSFVIASAYAPRVKYVQILLSSTSSRQVPRWIKECHVTPGEVTNFAYQYILPKDIKGCRE